MSDTAVITARGKSLRSIEALLHGQSAVVAGTERETPYGSIAVLVTAPAEQAQAQEDRFGSGLVGARVHGSLAEAVAYGREDMEVDWSGVTLP